MSGKTPAEIWEEMELRAEFGKGRLLLRLPDEGKKPAEFTPEENYMKGMLMDLSASGLARIRGTEERNVPLPGGALHTTFIAFWSRTDLGRQVAEHGRTQS